MGGFCQKIEQIIGYVKHCKKEQMQVQNTEINQINRKHFETMNDDEKAIANVNDSKANVRVDADVEITRDDVDSPQMKHKLELYMENVLETDEFVQLTNGNNKTNILQKERRLLIGNVLKLMSMMTEFMSHKQIKKALLNQEFELMQLLRSYAKNGNDEFNLYSKLSKKSRIFADKFKKDFDETINDNRTQQMNS